MLPSPGLVIHDGNERAKAQLALLDLDTLVFAFFVLTSGSSIG